LICFFFLFKIWNVSDGTPVANYRGHNDKVICCMFSNNNPEIVYSGGVDYALHSWHISKQQNQLPPDECTQFLINPKILNVKLNVFSLSPKAKFCLAKRKSNFLRKLRQKQKAKKP
jgi:WD40 repeat protein